MIVLCVYTVYLKKKTTKRFTKPTLHATYASPGYASDIFALSCPVFNSYSLIKFIYCNLCV